MPFWHGDAVGRPIELGRAIGAFLRELEPMDPPPRCDASARITRSTSWRRATCVAYLGEQREVTGALPTDRTIVVERFRDELGDWRVALLTPFGGRVHAPGRWRSSRGSASATASRSRPSGPTTASPSGCRRGSRPTAPTIEGALLVEPDEVEDLLMAELGGVGAVRRPLPRERRSGPAPAAPPARASARRCGCSARSRPTCSPSPASTARSRSSSRPTASSCATSSTCRRSSSCSASIRARRIRVVSVESRSASPFASSLVFDYLGSFMYEGDAPLAERRAQALTLDRDLLAELLGSEELRELLDPEAVADLELELQALAGGAARDDARRRGRPAAPARRPAGRRGRGAVRRGLDGAAALVELEGARRALRVRIAGEERWIAVEDAGRYRDALGASPPPGVAETFLARDRRAARRAARALGAHAMRRSPPTAPASRWGIARATVEERLRALAAAGTLLEGAFRPGGAAHEFTDPEVLRQLRRRSLARLRREVEPVEPEVLARFLPAWQGVGGTAGGLGRLLEVVAQLEGVPDPGVGPRARRAAGAGRRLHAAPARRAGRRGRGRLDRARHARTRRRADRALPARPGRPAGQRRSGRRPPTEPIHDAIRQHLQRRGASFFPQLRAAAGRRAQRGRAARRALGSRLGRRGHERHVRRAARAVARRARGRRRAPRPGRLVALGPPRAAGRWSLVADLVGEERTPTERGHALATRAPRAPRRASPARRWRREGVAGGFAAVYPVLRAMEEAGRHAAATSWPAWGPPSSRCPERSTGCVRCATTTRRWRTHPGGHRPGPAVRRGARLAARVPTTSGFRSSVRPAPTSCSSTATPRSTSSAAAAAC